MTPFPALALVLTPDPRPPSSFLRSRFSRFQKGRAPRPPGARGRWPAALRADRAPARRAPLPPEGPPGEARRPGLNRLPPATGAPPLAQRPPAPHSERAALSLTLSSRPLFSSAAITPSLRRSCLPRQGFPDMAARSRALGEIAAILRSLAAEAGLAVMVTNHVTTQVRGRGRGAGFCSSISSERRAPHGAESSAPVALSLTPLFSFLSFPVLSFPFLFRLPQSPRRLGIG